MGLIEEVLSVFGDGIEDFSPGFKITVFGDRAVYIEGVKSIKSYSPDKMEILIKKGQIKITGEDLFVKKYCAEDLAVCGKIKAIERE